MKELKAFVHTRRLEAVVTALEDARAPGITVSRVHGVGYGYEPELFSLAPGEVTRTPEVAKIEVVCSAEDAERLLDVLCKAARTGYRGDGIVFVTPVERAVKIRSGEEGSASLA